MDLDPRAAVTDEDGVIVFGEARGRLFGIAYRILGSAADAEDVVQEAWLRWQQCDRSIVREPMAFLATATTRLAINVLQSARVRRETYVGPWLPSPVDTSNDPTLGAERGEALELATLLLMERLTPTERATYVLRQAFDYPYARIAEILETTEPAARQLFSRAQKHVAGGRPRMAGREAHQQFFRAFLEAARGGDVGALERLLAADAASYTDSAGLLHRAARRPILGREKIARFVAGFSHRLWAGTEVRAIEANGSESALLLHDGRVFAMVGVTVTPGAISDVWWVMNPDKLTAVSASRGLQTAPLLPFA